MKIAQAAKEFDISKDTLRYYEKVGLLPNVKKTKSGIRDYSQDDCKWIQFIICMRGAGLPIEVLSKYITLFHKGEETVSERKEILIEQRTQLIEKRDKINEIIARLDFKIDKYEQIIVENEKKLRKNSAIS